MKPASTGFPTKPCIYFSSPQTCHMLCPSHAPNHIQYCPFCLRHASSRPLSCHPDTQTLVVSEENKRKRSGDSELHPTNCHEDTEGGCRHSSSLLANSVLDGMGGQHYAPADLPSGMTRYVIYTLCIFYFSALLRVVIHLDFDAQILYCMA
jgi:hypothetical protein